jgi:hypothetical protein
MSDICSMLNGLKKRAAKLERQEAVNRPVEATETQPMSADEKTRLFGKITALCALLERLRRPS